MTLAPAEHRLLLAAAGTGTSLGTLQSVRRHWGERVFVVAVDINPPERVAASVLADAFVQVPPSSSPAFPAALLAVLRELRCDTYFPVIDAEITLATRLQDQGFFPPGVLLVGPSRGAAERCEDKLLTSRWLAAEGLPQPATVPLEEARWAGVPLLAKPRSGFGSVGVRELSSEAELDALRQSGGPYIVQALCGAPEVTIDAFRSVRSGLFRAVCRERLETKAGVCTKARVFHDDALCRLAAEIADRLPLSGTFCMQVMRDPGDAGWVITDINPRPGAATAMSAAVGLDFHAAALAEVWGEDPAPFLPPLARPRHVVRRYVELVTD